MKKTFKKITACFLVGAMTVMSLAGCSSKDDTDKTDKKTETTTDTEKKNATGEGTGFKSETVYVNCDAEGNIQKITVSDWIKNQDNYATLKDYSTLKDIINVKGNEELTNKDGALSWKAEGNDIFYQGTSDKKLPVTVSFKYFLDGNEVKASELAHKSGKLTIEVTYTNNETISVDGKDVYVPFVAMTGMILPEETFKNITVENGKTIATADTSIVVGYGLPGMNDNFNVSKDAVVRFPEKFTVTADVTDFSMGMTLTAYFTGLFNDVDLSEVENTGDIETIIAQLTDGITKLNNGANELDTKVGEFVKAVAALPTGCKKVSSGIDEFIKGNGDILTGAKQIDAGIDTLSSGMATMYTTISTQADDYLNKITQMKKLQAGRKAAGADLTAAEYETLGQLEGAYTALKEMKDSLDKQKLTTKIGELSDGSKQLVTGIETFGTKLTELKTGFKQVSDGVDSVYTNLQALKAGTEELAGGTAELYTKVSGVINLLNADTKTIINELNGIIKASEEYDVYSDLAENQEGAVKFVIKTAEIK